MVTGVLGDKYGFIKPEIFIGPVISTYSNVFKAWTSASK